jgi:pimeloyl-ACP methyl ester carboxylesterase
MSLAVQRARETSRRLFIELMQKGSATVDKGTVNAELMSRFSRSGKEIALVRRGDQSLALQWEQSASPPDQAIAYTDHDTLHYTDDGYEALTARSTSSEATNVVDPLICNVIQMRLVCEMYGVPEVTDTALGQFIVEGYAARFRRLIDGEPALADPFRFSETPEGFEKMNQVFEGKLDPAQRAAIAGIRTRLEAPANPGKGLEPRPGKGLEPRPGKGLEPRTYDLPENTPQPVRQKVGEGPSRGNVVVVHGLGAHPNSRFFEATTQALGDEGGSYEVTRPWTRPMTNDGRKSLGVQTFEDGIARVEPILEATPGPIVLVGHSLGGLEVLELARRFPEKVKAVVLVNPAIGAMKAAWERVFIGRPVPQEVGVLHRAMQNVEKALSVVTRLLPKRVSALDFLVDALRALPFHLGPAVAEAVPAKIPILLFVGTADEVIPPQGIIDWALANADTVRLQQMEGLDHNMRVVNPALSFKPSAPESSIKGGPQKSAQRIDSVAQGEATDRAIHQMAKQMVDFIDGLDSPEPRTADGRNPN